MATLAASTDNRIPVLSIRIVFPSRFVVMEMSAMPQTSRRQTGWTPWPLVGVASPVACSRAESPAEQVTEGDFSLPFRCSSNAE